MLKIGELAKLCKTSAQTLRFYDTIGLLPADEVDPFTGYRYYAPEKAEVYHSIVELKQLGFSLDEIKDILRLPPEALEKLFRDKIHSLRSETRRNQNRIRHLQNRLSSPTEEERRAALALALESLAFENDPEVVGKWELVGEVEKKAFEAESPPPAVACPHAPLPRVLFFLPGGAFYWVYGWSRGVLWHIDQWRAAPVPNPYRLLHSGTERFLLVQTGDIHAVTLLYRQLDNRLYTDRDTRLWRDEVDIPLLPDAALVGEWTTVDYVSDPDRFDPQSPEHTPDFFFTLGMSVMPRGRLTKLLRGPRGSYRRDYAYSAGVILDRDNEFAEHYQIRVIDGETYLLAEHKSGDYQYGGRVYGWYVFRKHRLS